MDWITHFTGLAGLEPGIRDRLVSRSRIVTLPQGTLLFGQGRSPETLFLLLSGTVRVQQVTGSGREIVLYRVHAGESCVLTTACLLAYEDHAAEGVAETDVEAVAIPRSVFDDLVATSQSFRNFVFSAYSRRFTDLFQVIDEIAFRKVDIRLAQKLLDLSDGQPRLKATHARLAAELGTAREVVSRQLQDFQRRGWVETARGEVTLTDPEALRALARAG
ncbi:Crp/Fnr family transcriptional regulator [Celeribacter indicus]|uniref:CarD family transcriptional regulator n=1 Tax=Celeribacter indicus TaxID=1208324 RepID=A0A0B5DZW2_9RHOB|nr:Crp/Fnr family transcriptional regulator [Celeribacter indicus]AJE46271.1 CarD family transcriptional regulator [Celeribacter indicus]SDW51788.1 cyclic nucleotide-binding protein [Celeribacter indicus]